MGGLFFVDIEKDNNSWSCIKPEEVKSLLEKFGLNEKNFNVSVIVQFHKDVRDSPKWNEIYTQIPTHFGKDWIEKEVENAKKFISNSAILNNNNKTDIKTFPISVHPLSLYWPLNGLKDTYAPDDILFLYDLAKNLRKFKEIKNTRDLINRLKKANEFYGALFEVKTINFLKSKGAEVEPHTRSGERGKDYDLDIIEDGESIPIECTRKMEIKKLKTRQDFFKRSSSEFVNLMINLKFNADIELFLHREINSSLENEIGEAMSKIIRHQKYGEIKEGKYTINVKKTWAYNKEVQIEKLGGKRGFDYSIFPIMEVESDRPIAKNLKGISYKFDDTLSIVKYVIDTYQRKTAQLPAGKIGIVFIELFDGLANDYLKEISSGLSELLEESSNVGCIVLVWNSHLKEAGDYVKRREFRAIANPKTKGFVENIKKYFI